MSNIKKITPKSPDLKLDKDRYGGSTLARLAHLNWLIDEINKEFSLISNPSSSTDNIQTVTFSRTLTADIANGIFTNDVISELPNLTSGVYAPIDVEIVFTKGNTNFQLNDNGDTTLSGRAWSIVLGAQIIEFLDRNGNYLYYFLQNATAGTKMYFRGVWSNSSAEGSYMVDGVEYTPSLSTDGFGFGPYFMWENGDTTTTVEFTVRYKILTN